VTFLKLLLLTELAIVAGVIVVYYLLIGARELIMWRGQRYKRLLGLPFCPRHLRRFSDLYEVCMACDREAPRLVKNYKAIR
jgi:hypothetical protein